MFAKITELLVSVTWGLFKQHQEKAFQILKVKAAAWYVENVRFVREQAIAFSFAFLALLMLAVGLIAIPVAIIFVVPWEISSKVVAILVVGLLYLAIPGLYLKYFFSEKRWMKLTKADKFVESVLENT